MTDALLLDTHIVLWLDKGSERLKPPTRAMIDECRRGGGTIMLSAISIWEIAMLLDARRIVFDFPLENWVDRFVAKVGIEAIPLTPRAASRAYEFHDLEQRDPGDRLLIATAIELDCPLVTYDGSILKFAKRHGRRYGFTAVS